MTKYREILRHASLGINQTGIANSCGCARKTVRNVLNRAKKLDIAWLLKADTTDADLEKLLFSDKYIPSVEHRYPDYEYIDKEMMRNEVTLKLLWNEYCEECRRANELSLMYSQFVNVKSVYVKGYIGLKINAFDYLVKKEQREGKIFEP